MKKRRVTLLIPFLLAGTLLASNDGSGTYFGIAGGWSCYKAKFIDEDYYIDDDETAGKTKTKSFDENDKGFKFYGGYQFNEIIAVEASFTDYGTLSSENYSQEPQSFAVYANAGYNFLNGQLRPFGLLGLGYLNSNQSRDLLDEDFVTVHAGGGVEYYPAVLKGLGFRAALEGDFYVNNESAYDDDNNHYSSETFFQRYMMFYIGVQYKF
ncbi:MAG: hypothetical protein B5M52_05765 [Helicobacteraceae bacterium 4484_230]|nr:MAG: hypothetical protein B5M52_05765 [Helicobacteraceae bacterium 4484_230]